MQSLWRERKRRCLISGKITRILQIMVLLLLIEEGKSKEAVESSHVVETDRAGRKHNNYQAEGREEIKIEDIEGEEKMHDGFSVHTSTKKLPEIHKDVDVTEELSKIDGYVKGKEYYGLGEYEDAQIQFTKALSDIEDEKDSVKKETMRRAISMYRAKTYFEQGMFEEASNEAMRLQVLSGDAITLLKKSMQFAELMRNPTEKEITEALKECSNSPSLLKMRVNMRLKKGLYGLCKLDIKRLMGIKSQEKQAKRLQMHCDFLMGNYNEGIRVLEEQSDCTVIYNRAKKIVDIYNSILKKNRITSFDYQKLKTVIDSDLKIAMVLDTKFVPSIFTKLKKDMIRKLVWIGKNIGKGKEILSYSEETIKEEMNPVEEDYAAHAELLISMDRFQSAEILIKQKMNPESARTKAVRKIYNERAQKLRKEKEEKEKERKRKAEENIKRTKKENMEKEKKRCERRKKFVESRRGYRIMDSEGFYKFLGLKPGADVKSILSAYRKITRDANIARKKKNIDKKEAEKGRQLIITANKAKDVLSNPEKKAEYDSGWYMTEKEKEEWGYNDEAMEHYEENGGQHQKYSNLFDILLNGGSSGSSGFDGFGGFGGGFGGGGFGGDFGSGRRRVVYYM